MLNNMLGEEREGEIKGREKGKEGKEDGDLSVLVIKYMGPSAGQVSLFIVFLMQVLELLRN